MAAAKIDRMKFVDTNFDHVVIDHVVFPISSPLVYVAF